MDLEDLQCAICERLYAGTGDSIPRLMPENGLTYCTACVNEMIQKSEGQESFFCPEDDETPVIRKSEAKLYPKNFMLIKMAAKFKKQQEANQGPQPVKRTGSLVDDPSHNIQVVPQQMASSVIVQNNQQIPEEPAENWCQIHKRKIEIICIDCKERICSQCALFGPHKNHDIRMEQDVLDEINLRTECLMEMYQIVEQTASEKPDQQVVQQIEQTFKQKSNDLRAQIKSKFGDMRARLKIQEQTVEAILSKNIKYVDNELKSLRAVDYSMFNEGEKWLLNAKVKLDNFQKNNNNPLYIAFDMLQNAKQSSNIDDPLGGEDNLLDEVDNNGKQIDIISYGEKIADILGKVKTINPSLLASQLNQLSLTFEQDIIDQIGNVAKCTAIDGVEVSQEELDALKEASAFGGAGNNNNDVVDELISQPIQKANTQMKMNSHIGSEMLEDQLGALNIQSKLSLSKKASTSQMIPNPMAQKPPLQQQNSYGLSQTGSAMNQGMNINNNPVSNDGDPFGQQMQTNSYVQPQNFNQPTHDQQFDDMHTGQMEDPQSTTDTGVEEDLDPEFLAEVETYLKECMEHNELSIDMSDTLIKDHGAKMVAAAASLCDQLQELRLQQCGITDDGAIEIFNELICLGQLQVIDLSFNPITEKSMDSLTRLLNTNTNLVVNMRMNGIKNKFAVKKMLKYEQQGRLNIQNQ